MLVVIAKLSVKPGKKAELFAAAQDVIKGTRAEAGCVSYTLFDDPSDEGSCSFVEEWVDKAALEQHFLTPHIKAWRQASAELLAGKTALTLYQAEETTL